MFKLALIHLQRYFKNPILLLMMGPVPLLLVVGSLFSSDSDNNNLIPKVAFILETKGSYETALLEDLQVEDQYIYLNDKSTALNELKSNELAGVIYIPSSFSEELANGLKPNLTIYKTTNAAGTAETELAVEAKIKSWLKDYYQLEDINPTKTVIESKQNNTDMSFTMFIVMIIYFMFIAAATLARDVQQLKQQKILHRTLSTANKDHQIFGGLVLAMCLVQGICFTIVYYLGTLILDVSIPNVFLPLLLMFTMSFVASSLVIFLTRIFKHPNLLEIVIIMYTLVGFILSILPLDIFNLGISSAFATNIAKLFPIYWAFDAALNFTLWPNLFIIFLFGMVFLSAGSFKLKNFIQS